MLSCTRRTPGCVGIRELEHILLLPEGSFLPVRSVLPQSSTCCVGRHNRRRSCKCRKWVGPRHNEVGMRYHIRSKLGCWDIDVPVLPDDVYFDMDLDALDLDMVLLLYTTDVARRNRPVAATCPVGSRNRPGMIYRKPLWVSDRKSVGSSYRTSTTLGCEGKRSSLPRIHRGCSRFHPSSVSRCIPVVMVCIRGGDT